MYIYFLHIHIQHNNLIMNVLKFPFCWKQFLVEVLLLRNLFLGFHGLTSLQCLMIACKADHVDQRGSQKSLTTTLGNPRWLKKFCQMVVH